MPMENLSVSSTKPIGEPIRVLLVEDNPADAELVIRGLRAAGFEPNFTRVDTEEAYLRELDGHPDLILSDWSMPQFDGLRALNLLRGRGMDMPFIIVSGSIGEETAVTAMRHGASDYLLKDRLVRLGQAVRQALGQGRASQERREAAARLQASEDRLRSVVETISDVIWVAEPGALRPTFLGPAFETVWGRPRADFLAGTDTSVLDSVHQEDRAIFVRAVAEQAAGHATSTEYRILRPDGEVRWIRDEGFPVRDASGRVTTINGIASDITDRKRTEEELRRRTAFFEGQVDSALDGILVVDSQGKKVIQNQRLADLWKIPPEFAADEDDTGQFRFVTSRVKNPEEFAAKVRHLYSNPEAVSREEIELVDGTLLDRYSAPIRDKSGTYYGRIWSFRDVTERRTLEAQLRQAQKMEAIGQLSSGVAHDFNNLLTIIASNASMLLHTAGGNPEVADYVGQINQASERAAGLTRQLLLFSRKQVMQPVDLDLNEVVGTMTRMLQRILGEDIALGGEFAPGLPSIHADAGMIEQVLLNFAVNSRDAMPSGGRLTIRTHVEVLDESQARRHPGVRPGRYVCLSVSDTGCGIAPEHLPRLFEPFFTTKEVGKGTGLGLATVYGIVQQHQGWIEVASAPGEGTTFRIGLPAVAAAPARRPAGRNGRGLLVQGTGTILVVEDETSLRLIVVHALQRCGYKVLTATTGLTALEVWKEHGPSIDLLLTDMIMPDGMTGRQLAARLVAERPGLKVVYTSGYSPDVVGGGAVFREGFDFLQKPFGVDQLSEIMRVRLGRG
jgi:two-component system, cell cycle sensor histidine kinase and response regulator CckA